MADLPLGPGELNLRAGLADGDVSAADAFVGAAYAQAMGTGRLGLALGWIRASDELEDVDPEADDTVHAEAYCRFDPGAHVPVTPSLQWVANTGLDGSDAPIDDRVWVVGVRVAVSY